MGQTQVGFFALREEGVVLDKREVLDKAMFMGLLMTLTIPVVHSLLCFWS